MFQSHPLPRLLAIGVLSLGVTVLGSHIGQATSGLQTRPARATIPTNRIALASLKVGEPAPAFTATDSNGKRHRLSDFKGKVVVLEWTNHQCPFVVKHYVTDNMQKLQQEAKAKGLIWLSVVSSAPGQQGFVKGDEANQLTSSRKASPTAVLLDPEGSLGKLYGARTTPHMFIIDAQGVLRYNGAIDDNPSRNPEDVKTANNYVRAALTSILGGQPVKNATTQPYGCNVKYGS